MARKISIAVCHQKCRLSCSTKILYPWYYTFRCLLNEGWGVPFYRWEEHPFIIEIVECYIKLITFQNTGNKITVSNYLNNHSKCIVGSQLPLKIIPLFTENDIPQFSLYSVFKEDFFQNTNTIVWFRYFLLHSFIIWSQRLLASI